MTDDEAEVLLDQILETGSWEGTGFQFRGFDEDQEMVFGGKLPEALRHALSRRRILLVHEDFPHETRDLELYTDHTGDLHPQRVAIEQNLERKLKRGKYDPTLAPKAWQYLVDAAAKRYVKEMGGQVRTMFPKREVREVLAHNYARAWEAENLPSSNPKKSLVAALKR